MPLSIRAGVRAALLAGTTLLPLAATVAQTVPGDQPTPSAAQPQGAANGQGNENLQEIVVTGTTSRNRSLISSSADITYATRADIDRRAPKSTADLLEMVPGIFVEATAGELSNNYSVRGLQGGGQRFIQLEEDGMPVVYQGGGADFIFSNDITIDRMEAVKGGSSGVLTVNGAGATINFIDRRPNFDRFEGIARVTGYSYGLKRGDFYASAPIADKLAFNVGGYFESSPGVRKNPFDYNGYRLKAALEYRMDDGGYIRLSGKIGDLKTAYYADQPYRYQNGKPSAVPGLGTQFGNVGGDAFASIAVPTSTFADPSGFREFNYRDGVHVKNKQIRLDIEKPVADGFTLFAKTRYVDYSWDFNGLFPGSGTGNAGLTSAVNYLTPGANSPINDLLTAGLAAFPGTTQFGIKNLRTGVVTAASQVSALNALNGNGFLQRTTLNHDYTKGKDFGLNAGGRWETNGDSFKNSLTVGGMYYWTKRAQDQSATASVVNDVKTNSDIYDVVALNGSNQVIGTLSDNGLVSYGDWGAGIRDRRDSTFSLYANDELTIGDHLHIDGGLRYEQDSARYREGNALPNSQPVQPGVVGVLRTVGSAWDGTYTVVNKTQSKIAWTLGVNYQFTNNFAAYARYAKGFQTNSTDPITEIELYEAGLRYQYRRLFSGSVTVFQTNFDKQFYNFIDPTNPTVQTSYLADLRTRGVEVDATVRPIDWFSVDFAGVFQDPKLLNLTLGGQPAPAYSGNRPERTPATLYTITPTIQLPNGLGSFYGRYKYIGKIFADSGNGVALPGYGVTSLGVDLNVHKNVQVSFNVENLFNVIGLTEGNPRQGQTQNASSGYFYARGIVGTTYGGSVTFKF